MSGAAFNTARHFFPAFPCSRYEVLGDEQKRANYDRFGFAGVDGGFAGGGAGGFDYNDLFRQATGGYGFEDFFGSMFGGGQTRRPWHS